MSNQTENVLASDGIDSAAQTPREAPGNRTGLIAAGGVIAAIAASTCCVVPFALVTLGISGAWIGKLTALAPYQPIFIVLTVALLGAGFFKVYRKPKAIDCGEGGYCAKPISKRITKIFLWVATGIVMVSLGWPYILPLIAGSPFGDG